MRKIERKNNSNALINPLPSSKAAHNRMIAVRRSNTSPEIALRKEIYKKGLRYRINIKPIKEINRTADILFRSVKVAVFVDGCFWHGCPIHGTKSKSNAIFWKNKITLNIRRDLDTSSKLKLAGWKVIRIWEHENPNIASNKILSLINRQRNKK